MMVETEAAALWVDLVWVIAGSNANEGYWSLIYAMWDVYKNEEMTEEERQIKKRAYKQAVKSIYGRFPRWVLWKEKHCKK